MKITIQKKPLKVLRISLALSCVFLAFTFTTWMVPLLGAGAVFGYLAYHENNDWTINIPIKK